MATNRPPGVTLLGVVFIILGLLSLFWSMLVFGFGAATSVTGAIFGDQAMTAVGGNQTVSGIVGIVGAAGDAGRRYGVLGRHAGRGV